MPILFFAAAGALFAGGIAGGAGGGWYLWRRGQQEAAKRLQHQDAEAAKQALRDALDLADLRRKAQEVGLNPDEVVAGYETLRDSQLSPEDVLKGLSRAAITG
ncbi:hypothetical protein ACF1AO_09505 [Streptomyces longwoodensis]|uniref:hypothetical protein n=1 Tax=Streptomyces longwoodensis TaxID=68231 RepID=UPI00370260A3